ncbi:MAG TPA: hypothetical protein VFE51_06095 [Verrucomicrobiae bacterium]|nr:hypothetical protein [Verrucomicrobiae bacterium]
MTPDGRYVLFASTANNLVILSNGTTIPVLIPPRQNVYLRDRQSGATTLVSSDRLGFVGADANATPTSLSSDGRYALFESSAANLVAGVTNGLNQVFVRDLKQGATLLVSVATNGAAGDGVSRSSSMTPDGRFVAFVSEAENLIAGDTNGIPDVFVRDLQNGITVLASVGATSTNSSYPVGASESPVMTPDGRYVAFFSTATNLVPQRTFSGNIYVRDLIAQQTTLVSAQAQTVVTSMVSVFAAPACHSQTISDDGRYVAYVVSPLPSTRLGVYYSSVRGFVLRHDLQTGQEDLINTNCYVTPGPYETVRVLDMTKDGRFVAFVANTNGLFGETTCIFVWDAASGLNTLASGDLSNSVPAGSACQWPVFDSSGNFLAFFSSATNVTTNSLKGNVHLYVRDLLNQRSVMVNVDTNGAGAEINPTTIPRFSDGGRLLAFESPDPSVVGGDRNRSFDVFVRDLGSNTTELISAAHPVLNENTPNGNSGMTGPSISADGRFVAFASDADDLVSNDTNGSRDVFVRDLVTGSNILVSVDLSGSANGNGVSYEPSITPDGRYVLFTSSATDLVAGDTNGAPDVFVRDLQSGTTRLVSTNLGASTSLIPLPSSDSITAEGTSALFHTQLRGYPRLNQNLYSADLQTGTVAPLTPGGFLSAAFSDNGRFAAFVNNNDAATGSVVVCSAVVGAPAYTNIGLGAVSVLGLSSDGNILIYSTNNVQILAADHAAQSIWRVGGGYLRTHAGFRFSADNRFLSYAAALSPSGPTQVYLYDLQQRTSVLVSHRNQSPVMANGNSDSPIVSPDARFVAFRSDATDLLPSHTNTVPDIFLCDRLTKANTLVTAGTDSAGLADNRSLFPVFSQDGRTLVVQSSAGNLVRQDLNRAQDLFAFTLLYADLGRVPALGAGFWLSWPAVPGQTYTVQFKDNLPDATWTNATGTITNLGTKLFFSDSAPGATQRFYRINSL